MSRIRTPKQLANDERLRNKKKLDDDFEPTVVKEARLAQEAKLVEPTVTEEATEVTPDPILSPKLATPSPEEAPDLMKIVLQLQQTVIELQRANPQITQATPEEKFDEVAKTIPTNTSKARVGQQGIQGIIFKYEVDKGYYPDPTDRLLNEARLQRFAMKQNYIFKWTVDGIEYKKDNITYAEPRFTLELYRRLYNEDGEDTNRAALVARSMMHEDEMTTRVAASRLGLLDKFENTEDGFRLLMDEIRYYRMQQWLFGIFTPPKVQTYRKRPTTEVIAGKVVEVFDTEELTDHETASLQAASLATQTGVGSVPVPE